MQHTVHGIQYKCSVYRNHNAAHCTQYTVHSVQSTILSAQKTEKYTAHSILHTTQHPPGANPKVSHEFRRVCKGRQMWFTGLFGAFLSTLGPKFDYQRVLQRFPGPFLAAGAPLDLTGLLGPLGTVRILMQVPLWQGQGP